MTNNSAICQQPVPCKSKDLGANPGLLLRAAKELGAAPSQGLSAHGEMVSYQAKLAVGKDTGANIEVSCVAGP